MVRAEYPGKVVTEPATFGEFPRPDSESLAAVHLQRRVVLRMRVDATPECFLGRLHVLRPERRNTLIPVRLAWSADVHLRMVLRSCRAEVLIVGATMRVPGFGVVGLVDHESCRHDLAVVGFMIDVGVEAGRQRCLFRRPCFLLWVAELAALLVFGADDVDGLRELVVLGPAPCAGVRAIGCHGQTTFLSTPAARPNRYTATSTPAPVH